MRRAFRLSAVLAAVLAVQASPARAQLSGKPFEEGLRTPDSLLDGAAHDRRSQISGYGVFGWGVGVGLAARYSLPIFKDGFIPELNDSIEIDAGGDFLFGAFGVTPSAVIAAVEPRWTFHVAPQFDAYFKVGIGLFLWLGPTTFSPAYALASVGVAYKIFPNFWIRAEAGNFGGSVGVGLDF
ncbi:MAG TPA: hypothetical protein VIG99_13545 [Myxococcaceae bacterium]|jgi:hypothetical protein